MICSHTGGYSFQWPTGLRVEADIDRSDTSTLWKYTKCRDGHTIQNNQWGGGGWDTVGMDDRLTAVFC